MNGIITVTNQKGGIGKSTTVQAVGAGLSLRGYKVLLIDLDAQGNLTMATGAASSSGENARRSTAQTGNQKRKGQSAISPDHKAQHRKAGHHGPDQFKRPDKYRNGTVHTDPI